MVHNEKYPKFKVGDHVRILKYKNIFAKGYVDLKNLQVVVTESFKVKNKLSSEIMKQVFDFQVSCYNFRSVTSQSRRENTKTRHYDTRSVRFLGPKIWTMVPQNIKNCESLQEFKRLIKV